MFKRFAEAAKSPLGMVMALQIITIVVLISAVLSLSDRVGHAASKASEASQRAESARVEVAAVSTEIRRIERLGFECTRDGRYLWGATVLPPAPEPSQMIVPGLAPSRD